MSNETVAASLPQGRVRWRRLAVILLPATALTAVLVGLTANGAIAASISVSGQEFLVTSSQLNGTGFEQYGGQVTGSNRTQPVVISAIHPATFAHLSPQVTVAEFS